MALQTAETNKTVIKCS